MAKIKNTSLRPILIRVGVSTITVSFEKYVEVGDLKKIRKNKIIDSYFRDGTLVEVKNDEKSDYRKGLEDQATELGINFPANIGDETLSNKIAEAEAAKED